ncbi:MAG: Clp protease N-terminal domain-containing protein [Terriglobales bacterium]
MGRVVFRLPVGGLRYNVTGADLAALAAVLLLLFAYLWLLRSARHRETRFTSEAQRAIAFARVEAERLQSPTIEPVHLLLGLLHVAVPAIVRYLPADSHQAIREEIRDRVGGGAIVDYRDDLPFSDDAQRALVAAAREARGLNSRQIGAEHLLLGLLHSDTSLAALILRERGLRIEPLRASLGGWQE